MQPFPSSSSDTRIWGVEGQEWKTENDHICLDVYLNDDRLIGRPRRITVTAPMSAISRTIPRSALVTGGAQRIGRTIAIALAEAGFDVAVHCNVSREAGAVTCEDIRRLGRRAVLLPADLMQEEQTRALMPEALAVLGPIGVLVNNASPFERDEWHDATRASWDAHIEPGLRAPFVLTQHFARALPPDAEGVVINMLDQRVWSITPHFVSYTVAKAGLWALTQSMALALAPRIRVNGIGPGPALANTRQTHEQFVRQSASVPLHRGTSPEEIARAVLAILALPAMTGQMLALDGGQHLQWQSGRHGPPPEE
jgi:NAD(P)-dependent dehydrogenase (short-subunit alcohol dehydrogenase family)